MLEVLKSQISSPSFPITLKFKTNIKYESFNIGMYFFKK